jgi:hypothetical protein
MIILITAGNAVRGQSMHGGDLRRGIFRCRGRLRRRACRCTAWTVGKPSSPLNNCTLSGYGCNGNNATATMQWQQCNGNNAAAHIVMITNTLTALLTALSLAAGRRARPCHRPGRFFSHTLAYPSLYRLSLYRPRRSAPTQSPSTCTTTGQCCDNNALLPHTIALPLLHSSAAAVESLPLHLYLYLA